MLCLECLEENMLFSGQQHRAQFGLNPALNTENAIGPVAKNPVHFFSGLEKISHKVIQRKNNVHRAKKIRMASKDRISLFSLLRPSFQKKNLRASRIVIQQWFGVGLFCCTVLRSGIYGVSDRLSVESFFIDLGRKWFLVSLYHLCLTERFYSLAAI